MSFQSHLGNGAARAIYSPVSNHHERGNNRVLQVIGPVRWTVRIRRKTVLPQFVVATLLRENVQLAQLSSMQAGLHCR